MRITPRRLVLFALLLGLIPSAWSAPPGSLFVIENSHEDSDLKFRGPVPWVFPDTGTIDWFSSRAPYFAVYSSTRSTERWTIFLKATGRGDLYLLELSEFEMAEAGAKESVLPVRSRTISSYDASLFYDSWVRLALSVRYGPRMFPAGNGWGFVSHTIGVRKGSLGYIFGTSIHLEAHPTVRTVREIGDDLRLFIKAGSREKADFPEPLRQRFSHLNVLLREPTASMAKPEKQ